MNFQTMSKQRKFVLIAALVGVVATFLPWWSFSTFGYAYSINGFHGLGILAFLCFVAAGVMAYMDDQTTNLNKTKWMATLIAGGIATLIILYYMVGSGSVMSTLGLGIYLSALAALGIVLSAFLFRSPTDDIKGGFDSLRNDISNRMKSDTPTTHSNSGTHNTNTPSPNRDTSNTGYSDTGSTSTGPINTGHTDTPDAEKPSHPNDLRRDIDDRNNPPSNPPM
jgi:hypothetical protein